MSDISKKLKQLSLKQGFDVMGVDIRNDEEQSVKLQEIIDLLVAAGYFRARIKGLSSFDKVVGGMTWCIETCNVDLDVDLLFQENSTIGQKIALTEKIVAVLPKMKCPHALEPHQIQGLDFIHIYPIIQWLVKSSMEYRQEISSLVRSYAVYQFNKDFKMPDISSSKKKGMQENIQMVNEIYRPRRIYKRISNAPENFSSQVHVTLMEYDEMGSFIKTIKDSGVHQGEEIYCEEMENSISSNYSKIKDDVDFTYLNLENKDIDLLKRHFNKLQTEFQKRGKNFDEIIIYETEKLKQKINAMKMRKTKLINIIENIENDIADTQNKQRQAEDSLIELENIITNRPEFSKKVEDMVVLNDGLRRKELEFRENCKREMKNLQELIEKESLKVNTLKEEHPNKEEPKYLEKEEKLKARLSEDKLLLAKLNRSVATLQRRLDDFPTRAELAQYQKRFIELYNQVAAKHKETKQYYTLYNTLLDTRQYMKREMSLLNSISDSYPDAIQSPDGRKDFLQQLQSIVENVKQSRVKVDAKLTTEKRNRDELNRKLKNLIDLQRKYANAVRLLEEECKQV